jgi:carboxymethylenebutenolidase
MKRAILLVGALGIAAQAHAQQPRAAQQPASDSAAAHVHMEAQAPPPAAPQGGPGPGAQRGGQPQTPPIEVPWNDAIPAGTPEHAARALKESPRHGEWVDIKMKDGTALKAWVVYPERPNKTGVVLVIHDIFGMRDLPRAVGDQLAQDGFIAIVPDFLSGKGPNGGGSDSLGSGVNQAIMSLAPADVVARLDAAMEYGKGLAASNGKTGVIGFCWGGGRSFGYAAAQPALNAAVVYYGDAPGASAPGATEDTVAAQLANVKAPVLGLYAGNDARIGATIPVTEAAMKKNGKSYEVHTYEGAGHGFMGQQAGAGGANLKAAEQSWPLVVQFLTKNLQ